MVYRCIILHNGQKLWEAIYENDMEGGGGGMSVIKDKKFTEHLLSLYLQIMQFILVCLEPEIERNMLKNTIWNPENCLGIRKSNWSILYAKYLQNRR